LALVRSRRWLPPALAALAWLLAAAPAGAATFDVTTTADLAGGIPDGTCTTCSLREAVRDARVTDEDDRINLPPGTYLLTGLPDENSAASGDLDLNAGFGGFTIVGSGARATAIDGGQVDRVFSVPSGGELDLSAVTVKGGKVTNDSGGGINSAGSVSLTDVAVTGNGSEDGGGIASTGSLALVRTTVSGNVATGSGGGIDATRVSAQFPGAITLTNSTLSWNRSAGRGAGVANSGGTVRLQSSTIAGNDGGSGNGRGLDLDDATAVVANSVIAGNLDGDCRAVAGGSIGSQGGNLASEAACGFGPAVDPRLGPLADNGGQTDTQALPAGSPAIDAGTGPGCPATDQRGQPRPRGAACDSGAFEVQPALADAVAPLLTSLAVSNRVFRVDRRGLAAARRRVPRGTRFRFVLSEPAGVSFSIARRTRGRRVGTRCVRGAPRRRSRAGHFARSRARGGRSARSRARGGRSARACFRWVRVWRFARAGIAGPNSARFSGRVRRGRKVRSLRPGRYRASVRAADAAGNHSKLSRVGFRVVR
jgi:CSLREA domain-containing protein